MKDKKNVFILNYASHYRLSIFEKLSKELNADFYFGNIPNSTIKKIDYSKMPNFKREFKTFNFKNMYWYFGSCSILFKPYKNFVLTGDPHIISNWFILFMAKVLKKNICLWTHGYYGNEKGIKKVLKKIYFKMSDKVLLYGEYAKGLMIKEGFKEHNLIVIYNSLDYDNQISVRKKLVKNNLYVNYFNNNHPTLFYIGRIQRSKKLEMIIEAIKSLEKQSFNINLVIIGKQEADYSLNSYIQYKNLEKNVWLYGPLYNEEEIGNLIYNADLCVSPGNIGLTAIHSLMYGTPVITHNNFQNQGPEFEAIKEGVNGGFFYENDINSLRNKIIEILGLNISAEACYKVVDEKWNPNNQIKIFKNAFNR